jgi:Lrp/AsnC family transcriptional regulator
MPEIRSDKAEDKNIRAPDAFDRKILRALQEDASLSLAQIAHMVGLSPTPCWKRIQRLEQDGVIRRRVAILDPQQLGLKLDTFVSVQIADHTPESIEHFIAGVSALPEVLGLYRMAGDIDFLLHVITTGPDEFDRFYKKLITIASLRNVVSRFSLERLKAETALPI